MYFSNWIAIKSKSYSKVKETRVCYTLDVQSIDHDRISKVDLFSVSIRK